MNSLPHTITQVVMFERLLILPICSANGGSIYLNFPFCTRYCSFCHYVPNLIFGSKSIPDAYIRLLIEQLNIFFQNTSSSREFASCTFGGGSPSLLLPQQIQQIQKVFDDYNIKFQEISIEIHPETWNKEYLALEFFNRYSIGVQSFDTDWLRTHNRFPAAFDFIQHIVQEIRSYSTDVRLNIDIVFESVFSVNHFRLADSLSPDIITVYPLTRNRKFSEISNIYNEIINATEICDSYWRISENSFIFQKELYPNSFYTRDGMVYLNDIYGFGHNSKSSIGQFQYLSQYNKMFTEWEFIKKNQNRYWNMLFFSLPFGINHLLLEKTDIGIKQFLLPAVDSDFYFLPYKNIPGFYEHLQRTSHQEFENVFFQALCFGSSRPYDFPVPAVS